MVEEDEADPLTVLKEKIGLDTAIENLILFDNNGAPVAALPMLSRALGAVDASSVEQARTQLAADSFDLVLCDILMPDGNGLDLLRELRERRSRAVLRGARASDSSRTLALLPVQLRDRGERGRDQARAAGLRA